MSVMVGWERQNGRWLVAGAVVGGILLAVGLALHSRGGWGAAANVVTVMAVVPMIGAVLKFAQGKQRPSERKVSREIDLPGLLRDLAETHYIGRPQIQAAMPAWDADAFLAGTRPLTWDFVSAFLDVLAGGDRDIREGLEHFVRRVWKAARSQPGTQDPSPGTSAAAAVLVSAGTDRWLVTNEMAATATLTVERLQDSTGQLEAWREALVFTLGKYAESIRKLTGDRDRLADDLAAARARAKQTQAGQAERVRLVTADLNDVRERLDQATDLHDRTSQRLKQTRAQLEKAQELRDEAVTQAVTFRRQLAALEHRQLIGARAVRELPAPCLDEPMGPADRGLGEAILDRADEFLRVQGTAIGQEATTVGQLRRAVGQGGTGAQSGTARTMPDHRREAAVLGTAIVLIAAAVAVTLVLTSSPAPHRPVAQASVTQSPVAQTPTGQPAATASATASARQSSRPKPFTVIVPLAEPGYVPEAVAFSPDGKTVAVATNDPSLGKDSTYLWNLATPDARPAKLSYPGDNTVQTVAFSADSTMLAVSDSGNSAFVWNLATHTGPVKLTDPGGQGVLSVAFNPKNAIMLATCDADGSAYLWNLSTPQASPVKLAGPASPAVHELAFSPDGTYLAGGALDSVTYLWRTATPHVSPVKLNDGDGFPVTAVAFNANSTMLAAGDGVNGIFVWNLATRDKPAALADPESAGVEAIAFSPVDDDTFAVGDGNHSAYLWNLADSANPIMLHVPQETYGVSSVAFSPSGTVLATADHYGITYLWSLPS
jgi:hypothetical protein